mmetsp:Transcript_21345/g.60103  ORF Transcript_21345/g.60103 Transcript_21345/m.60103 type:complete len:207 (+) Transcript_21345:33-653(+)
MNRVYGLRRRPGAFPLGEQRRPPTVGAVLDLAPLEELGALLAPVQGAERLHHLGGGHLRHRRVAVLADVHGQRALEARGHLVPVGHARGARSGVQLLRHPHPGPVVGAEHHVLALGLGLGVEPHEMDDVIHCPAPRHRHPLVCQQRVVLRRQAGLQLRREARVPAAHVVVEVAQRLDRQLGRLGLLLLALLGLEAVELAGGRGGLL